MENNASGGNAQLHATVTITRKATGLQETYTLVGTPVTDRSNSPGASDPQPATLVNAQQPKE